MVRVSDLEASLDFYCNKLGLKEARRIDSEKGGVSATEGMREAPDKFAAAIMARCTAAARGSASRAYAPARAAAQDERSATFVGSASGGAHSASGVK